MAYRSADLRWPAEEMTGIPGEKVRMQHLGEGTGNPRFYGVHLAPSGWLKLPAEPKARYVVVVSGLVTFIDDGGALEIVTRCQTFVATANQPLELHTGDGCELFIVETDTVSAPAPFLDDRLAERRARQAAAKGAPALVPKGPVREFWGRLARRRDRKQG